MWQQGLKHGFDRMKAFVPSLLSPGFRIWLALSVVFTALSTFLPSQLPFAYDYHKFFFTPSRFPPYYPPWSHWIITPLRYSALAGLTLSSFAAIVFLRTRSLAVAVITFFNLPLFWTLYLGQVDGLVLLGLLGLPWLAPLVLIKPQVAALPLLARRRWMVFAALFLAGSLLLWPLWPIRMIRLGFSAHHTQPQDIALGWWGLLPALYLLWKMPKHDPDWWMVTNALITPCLNPYNLLPLMPAAARLPFPWALAIALTSWLPLSANWVGPWGWYLGWLSVGLLALGLSKHRERSPSKPYGFWE